MTEATVEKSAERAGVQLQRSTRRAAVPGPQVTGPLRPMSVAASNMAVQRMASSAHSAPGRIQRKCACGGEAGPDGECEACRKKRLEMQRRAAGPAAPSPAMASVRAAIDSPGNSLDAGTRSQMEPGFGYDFSGVRLHTGESAAASAREVNALAYTVGRDIVFGAGQYNPGSAQGRGLIAHELAHVVQQSSGRVAIPSGIDSGPSDPLEQAAEHQAQRVLSGLPASPSSSPSSSPWSSPSSPSPGPLQRLANTGGGLVVQRRIVEGSQPPPDETAFRRLLSQKEMFRRLFMEQRYGCWCGYEQVCWEVRDNIDQCCKEHDTAYERAGVMTGGINMWSWQGLLTTRAADEALIRCSDATLRDGHFYGPAANVYRRGIGLIFGGRAGLASMLRPAPDNRDDVMIPNQTFLQQISATFDLFDETLTIPLPGIRVPLIGRIGLSATIGAKGALDLKFGPGTLRDIRLSSTPGLTSGSARAALMIPASIGGRIGLRGSITADARIAEVTGSISAMATASLLSALMGSADMTYSDTDPYSFQVGLAVATGPYLTLRLDADIDVSALGRSVWGRRWNLADWRWGRAISVGLNFRITMSNGTPTFDVEPTVGTIPIEDILKAIMEGQESAAPQRQQGEVTPEAGPAEARLQTLLAATAHDEDAILTLLATATTEERAAILANQDLMGRLGSALSAEAMATARRILNNQPSLTVPSLDEATYFLANKAIQAAQHENALRIVLRYLETRRIINPTLAIFSYDSSTDHGEGLTQSRGRIDDPAGVRRPVGPAAVTIYAPAFTSVAWLYSSIMHEYVHVLDFQQEIPLVDWNAPDASERREVQAYLWEIEHSVGSGLINVPAGMHDLGTRLRQHYESLTPASQAEFRERYEAARRRVDQAQEGVNLPSYEEARRRVQEIAAQIDALVRRRPTIPDNASDEERRRIENEQREIDEQIARLQEQRRDALIEVVLTENPNVQIVDRARGVYRTPVVDGSGLVQWVYGSVTVLWHLDALSPSAFSLAGDLRARPTARSGVTTRLLVGGSGAQSVVQPYPGDIDFAEEIQVRARTAEAAGWELAGTIIEFVMRNERNPNLEFNRLKLRDPQPLPEPGTPGADPHAHEVPPEDYNWDMARIRRASRNRREKEALARQLAGMGNRGWRVLTFWRAFVAGGRYIEVTKVLNIQAINSETEQTMFSTDWLGSEFQEGYLDRPDEIEPRNPPLDPVRLGAYAALMRDKAIKEAKDGKWLKASKRSFNYCRAIGNLEGMNAFVPIFSTHQARVNQAVSEADAIKITLRYGTRLMTIENARLVLRSVGLSIRSLPPVPTLPPPEQTATDLEAFGSRLPYDERTRLLQRATDPDPGTGKSLFDEFSEFLANRVDPLLNTSLADQVRPLIERYIGPIT